MKLIIDRIYLSRYARNNNSSNLLWIRRILFADEGLYKIVVSPLFL